MTVLVAGVVFSPGGKVYSFDPDGLDLHWNDKVICQTSRGLEFGRVVEGNHEVDDTPEPLRKIVRRASQRDDETVRKHKEASKRCITEFREILREGGHEGIRPLAADISFDGHRVTISYRAEDKVELKALAPELAHRLGRRVDLRQVSPREGARACGGIGMCGDRLCCTRFPSHQQPITLRMAKDQELPMNPGRITGLCGRLRCCLAFEHPVYRSFRDRAPAVGRMVKTPQGRGIVRNYKVLDDTLVVALEGQQGEVDIRVDDAMEIKGPAR
jgi:cell fate regulator YaaT (PSP1 superfamily)